MGADFPPRTIAPAFMGIGGFIGLTPGGPVGKPVRISSWTQFARIYGDPNEPDNGPFLDNANIAHAVRGFFTNGGRVCWVVRVNRSSGGGPAAAALPAAADTRVEAFRVLARGEGTDELSVDVGPGADILTYRLVVTAGDQTETHDGLSLKKGRNHIVTKVNAESKLIKIEDTGASLPALRAPAPGSYRLASARDEVEPLAAERQGMAGLAAVDEITMVCVPDASSAERSARELVAHCEGAGDRVAIIDPPPGLSQQDILDWRAELGVSSSFAALYWPWIEVEDPVTGNPLAVPPGGHVAGAWTRQDVQQGIHDARTNVRILGAAGVNLDIAEEQQDSLDEAGINAIRSFPGRGIRIWGGRTLSSDPEWRYVALRRFVVFLERSIDQGTEWAVFEPNDEHLWKRLRSSISIFLGRLWEDGALAGVAPAEAYFVKCDEETNPPDVIEAGQVLVEIGVAPCEPGRFLKFRLAKPTAGPT